MPKLVELFENLIKRTLAPSAAFFFLVAVACLIDGVLHPHEGKSVGGVISLVGSLKDFTGPDVLKNKAALVVLSFLALLGTSYVLAIIQKFFVDDRLNANFESKRIFTADNERLKHLRGKVVSRIQSDLKPVKGIEVIEGKYFKDYLLYEILGGIDPTPTNAYVDRAKSFGITAISLVLVLIGWFAHLALYLVEFGLHSSLYLLVVLIVAVGSSVHEATKAEYRARAIRLYVNFLMMPKERIDALLLGIDVGDLISKPKADS
jgi:hypothetical protein